MCKFCKSNTVDNCQCEKAKRARIKKACTDAKPEHYAAVKKAWYEKNKDEILRKKAEYRAANREELSLKQSTYYSENKELIRPKALEYVKGRYRSEPLFALKMMCRRRIGFAFSKHGYTKNSPTQAMLGCSYEQLLLHLESQFVEGMDWNNRGEWHIDHIVPLASATNADELSRLCHFSNLQPLWALDNIRKGAKMVKTFEVKQ